MTRYAKLILQIFLFVLPWKSRRWFLSNLLGFELGKYSHIGFSLVLADQVKMNKGARILNFTFINQIDLLEMGQSSEIGSRNWITGANSRAKSFKSESRICHLTFGDHASMTSSHHIDCTGGVTIGNFSTLAGIRSQILTHEINLNENIQSFGTVEIGQYCFVSTGCIILMNSKLPDMSVLAAGAVLTKEYDDSFQIYAGVPAKPIKNIPEESKFFRRRIGYVS